MKINFLGNVCNHHYLLAKFLRRLGADAHLYYCVGGHYQTHPESDDPDDSAENTSWIHSFVRPFGKLAPRHWMGASFIKEISMSDLLEAQGPELIHAYRTGRPYVWHPYGDDLADMPFWWRFMRREPNTGLRLPDPRHVVTALSMIKAIRRASGIIAAWEDSNNDRGYELIRNLGCADRMAQLPLLMDMALFPSKWEVDVLTIRRELSHELGPDDFVIFHPTRQAFSRKAVFGKKDNDSLYKALARLHSQLLDFRLVIVDKGDPDVATAKRLLADLGLAGKVLWIGEMPRHRLVQWYLASDITADQFVAGAPGSVFHESVSCGTPVLTYLKTGPHRVFNMSPQNIFAEMPPVINARTEDEIYAVLHEAITARSRVEQLGRASRAWAVKYINGEVVAKRYLEYFEDLLNKIPKGK